MSRENADQSQTERQQDNPALSSSSQLITSAASSIQSTVLAQRAPNPHAPKSIQGSRLLALPEVLLSMVFIWLEPKMVAKIETVSQRMRSVAVSKPTWQQFILRAPSPHEIDEEDESKDKKDEKKSIETKVSAKDKFRNEVMLRLPIYVRSDDLGLAFWLSLWPIQQKVLESPQINRQVRDRALTMAQAISRVQDLKEDQFTYSEWKMIEAGENPALVKIASERIQISAEIDDEPSSIIKEIGICLWHVELFKLGLPWYEGQFKQLPEEDEVTASVFSDEVKAGSSVEEKDQNAPELPTAYSSMRALEILQKHDPKFYDKWVEGLPNSNALQKAHLKSPLIRKQIMADRLMPEDAIRESSPQAQERAGIRATFEESKEFDEAENEAKKIKMLMGYSRRDFHLVNESHIQMYHLNIDWCDKNGFPYKNSKAFKFFIGKDSRFYDEWVENRIQQGRLEPLQVSHLRSARVKEELRQGIWIEDIVRRCSSDKLRELTKGRPLANFQHEAICLGLDPKEACSCNMSRFHLQLLRLGEDICHAVPRVLWPSEVAMTKLIAIQGKKFFDDEREYIVKENGLTPAQFQYLTSPSVYQQIGIGIDYLSLGAAIEMVKAKVPAGEVKQQPESKRNQRGTSIVQPVAMIANLAILAEKTGEKIGEEPSAVIESSITATPA